MRRYCLGARREVSVRVPEAAGCVVVFERACSEAEAEEEHTKCGACVCCVSFQYR